MIKGSVASQVQTRINGILDRREQELQAIGEKLAEAKAQASAAAREIEDATSRTDLEAFEAGKAKKRKAQTAIDMYSGRYSQLEKQAFISEEESDRVIDSLLDYEKDLEGQFVLDIYEPLQKLKELQEKYSDEVAYTEQTIQNWTHNIHENYRGFGTTYRETGTSRSPRPVPVHLTPYLGCDKSKTIADFIKQIGA